MTLQKLLIKERLMTGPLAKDINTSHSALEVIKKFLLGQEQFKGGEQFLYFGNGLHVQYLENKKCNDKRLTKDEFTKIDLMCEALFDHPVCKALYKDSIREQKFYCILNGVKVAVILDIKQLAKKTGSDLKTTNAKTEEQCIAKAKEYGYFRQGVTYKKAAGLKHFFFIFVTKDVIPKIYILNIDLHKDEMLYAERELEWLLYMFKNYGKVIL